MAAIAVEVVSVDENGPARKAGLRERDLIVAVNGTSTTSVDDIHRILVGQSAESVFNLTILRNGKRQELRIVAGEV